MARIISNSSPCWTIRTDKITHMYIDPLDHKRVEMYVEGVPNGLVQAWPTEKDALEFYLMVKEQIENL